MKGLRCLIGNSVCFAIRYGTVKRWSSRQVCTHRIRCSTRCTRHGVDVDQLLWRLLADVKQRFDLARNVPNEAERLSWELPRFLDLAARKGRVILVIDGLHRLQDKSGEEESRARRAYFSVGDGGYYMCASPLRTLSPLFSSKSPDACARRLGHSFSGGETGLQWLPLQVPGNVRIIVTATYPNPDYLHLHEQKMRQHMFSQSSGSIGGGTGSGGGSSTVGRGQQHPETEGQTEAEYESSHRRRKVSGRLEV